MTTNTWYLKEEVYFEPLINYWYAWPYLIPPVTAARHIIHTHLRIMKSFINNHQLHMLANQESVLTGGEFLQASQQEVEQIKQLIHSIETEQKYIIELSQAVSQLEALLRDHQSGKSIEPLYHFIPPILKGFVELFLDMEHNPGYRLIEPLIYRSPLYRSNLQSISFGLLSKVGERPFVLSTPRLADKNHLHLNIHFNHEDLDRIVRCREHPIAFNDIKQLFLPLQKTGGLDVEELFTSEPPVSTYEPVTKGVRLRYLGHAGFLIENPKHTILIDPFIANRDHNNSDQVYSYSDLPPQIDYICLTHNHQDHVSFETLLQLRYKTRKILVPKNNGGTLADPSIRLLLKQLNFDVTEMDDLDEVIHPQLRIVSIPFIGEHGDLNIRSKTGWYVELEDKRMYFVADSSNPDEFLYAHLSSLLHQVDVFAIGMECVGAPYTWLYGALHTQMVPKSIRESRRLNGSTYEQASKMMEVIQPKKAYIYALGQEPWYKYFMGIEYVDDSEQIKQSSQLINHCLQQGLTIKTLYGRKTIEL